MKPKVSIVVPIFNVESYLGRCLDSLLQQTMKDIEIIAVNDGSTDTCGEILQQYAAKDNRIVVIEKKNGGVSSARNEGIRAANGAYIGFVDPDDWVDKDMYKEMHDTAIHEEADIVMCTYYREFGTHSKEKKFNLPEKLCYRDEEVQAELLRRLIGPLKDEIGKPEYLDAWGTVWSKLYRADMIKENELAFIDLEIVGTNEDSLFNIHTSYHAKTFVFLNKPYYHYWRVNTGSVTSGYKPDLKDKWYQLYSIIEGFITDKKLSSDFYLALNNRKCLNTLGLGLNTISINNKLPVFTKIRKLSTILNDNHLKSSFRQLDMAYFPVVWKVFYLCAKFRFVLGFYLMLLAIDRLRKAA
ncbi:glycosyltransferase family 2 protein [Paenibacillus eucommiae]|uniref:Glycosyltransferase EpsH n=1 Tax=Paenibacillus eucommiae TaxID=1355755 RepID=A0ABS4IS17_9BACL|nr:glycosyltransferase [Paenibacillus eucommiae]MBP1990372.1 glycosyltransferase EpsH [Paenibacillus eucommiae]